MPRPHKLTRRTLPAPPPAPDSKAQLAHIAELSRNARTTWFGLLGLLAFVGITLLGHKDAAFFAKGAATQLPLVGITVPVEAFFATAPVLVAAVYAYLHLYLMTLWDALAEADPRVDGKPLTERVYPWLISYAALWYRNRRQQDGSAAPRALGLVVVAVSVFLGWVLGIVVMAGLWVRSMPAHDELLTLWIGVCLWFAVQVGWTGFMTARARMAGAWRETVAAPYWSRRVFGITFAALLGVLSWETTEGGLIPESRYNVRAVILLSRELPFDKDIPLDFDNIFRADRTFPPLLIPANLREAELTPRPTDWKPFELWLRDLRRDRKKDGIETDPEQNPLIPTPEEMERWRLVIAALDTPELQNRDLRGADARNAFLPGSDLRGARMQSIDLSGSQIQRANLSEADLRSADFAVAMLQGADLRRANVQQSELSGASLQGAVLSEVELQGAYINGAKLHGADLSHAFLSGASLNGAELRGADCEWSEFIAVQILSSDLICHGLTSEQLVAAVGNDDTAFPTGIQARSCLSEQGFGTGEFKEKINDALSYHPLDAGHLKLSRDEVRDALFCDDGETWRWVGRHPEPDTESSTALGN